MPEVFQMAPARRELGKLAVSEPGHDSQTSVGEIWKLGLFF